MGNILNRDWAQHFDTPSADVSLSEESATTAATTTPTTAATRLRHGAAMADFDPRSPSSDIVRTPIYYLAEKNGDKKAVAAAGAKAGFVNDPRSPAYGDYRRTPILAAGGARGSKPLRCHDADDDDDSETNVSIESAASSDSSILLQTVPEAAAAGGAASAESPTQLAAGFKTAASNLPRHILQRKQVEKLNRKKIVADGGQDKENTA